MQVIRMHYRGKRYIVTMAPDERWTWIAVLSACLSVKGYAMTKFEAADQATHVIDRLLSLRARRAVGLPAEDGEGAAADLALEAWCVSGCLGVGRKGTNHSLP